MLDDGVREGEAITLQIDTVLVVEDSRPMQRVLRRLFEADSLKVHIASDGPAGLEQFCKQLPGVVVLDLNLPGISGLAIKPVTNAASSFLTHRHYFWHHCLLPQI